MKKLLLILPLALILCFMVGCQDKAAMAKLEEFKAQAEVEEQNKEIVRRYFELMDARDYALLELLSEAYVAHFPFGDIKGREEIKQVVDAYLTAFPDLSHFFSDFVAEGDKVVMRYGARGTQEGVFGEFPPSGKKMEATSMIIVRIKDGKMAEAWLEQDYYGMMMQLGMELKPKEEK
jgi:predicted ester cyclase